MDENSSSNSEQIESVIASFRNFSPEKPIENAVIYYWESHTNCPDDKDKHAATIDLIYKEFDMDSCEKYEIRTGYLNRYNYLPKTLNECAQEEIEKAIIKGKEEQNNWLSIYKPELPGFKQKNWEECIDEARNPYFRECKKLVKAKLQSNPEFMAAFDKTVDEYALKYQKNRKNGCLYLIEEMAWILNLPLIHLNEKQIYLIHLGKASDATAALFHYFPFLQKNIKWLAPDFRSLKFFNVPDFLITYRRKPHSGYSFALQEEIKQLTKQYRPGKHYSLEKFSYYLAQEQSENFLLKTIIGKIAGNIYWLDRNHIYLGCNSQQAEKLGLVSKEAIIGKTNYDLSPKEEAEKFNQINRIVMETGQIYEGEETALYQGALKTYLSQKMPLHNKDGKVIGLLGISFDITDRKRAEQLEKEKELMEAEEALRAKLLKVMHKKIQKVAQTIMKNIAHDIVYPLDNLITMIHCFCENMGKEKLELMDKNLNLILAAYERNRFYSYKTHIGKHYKTQIHRIQQSFCGVQEPDRGYEEPDHRQI